MPKSREARRRPSRTRRAVALCGALVALATACDPGLTWSVAGNGGSGNTGDGGPAVAATFTAPGSVAPIPGGGFYVADTTECVIRKVDAAGNIATIAGQAGTCASTGDGGTAASAGLDNPRALTVDGAGNLFFVDSTGAAAPPYSVVREISTDGTIATVSVNGDNWQTLWASPDGTLYAYIMLAIQGPFPQLDEAVTTRSAGGTWGPGHQLWLIHTLARPTSATPAASPPDVFTAMTYVSPGVVELLGASGQLFTYDLATETFTAGAKVAGLPYFGGAWLTRDAGGNSYVATTAQVWRVTPGGTVSLIAGTGTADPGTGAQYGPASGLNLTITGLAATPHAGLLISSGHVVYRVDHPATAPGT